MNVNSFYPGGHLPNVTVEVIFGGGPKPKVAVKPAEKHETKPSEHATHSTKAGSTSGSAHASATKSTSAPKATSSAAPSVSPSAPVDPSSLQGVQGGQASGGINEVLQTVLSFVSQLFDKILSVFSGLLGGGAVAPATLGGLAGETPGIAALQNGATAEGASGSNGGSTLSTIAKAIGGVFGGDSKGSGSILSKIGGYLGGLFGSDKSDKGGSGESSGGGFLSSLGGIASAVGSFFGF